MKLNSQIPRLRVAPKPCFPELFVDTDLSFKSLNKFVVILLFVEILQNIQTFHVQVFALRIWIKMEPKADLDSGLF